MHTFTVYCKMPEDRRGEYSEEIDVTIGSRSITHAKQAAQKIIDADYDPELRPVRVVYRPCGYFW
jgi:hypothetical protein